MRSNHTYHNGRMLGMFDDVRSFHNKFGIPKFRSVNDMPEDLVEFRRKFILEEAEETRNAFRDHDYPEALDGLIDLAYVLIGTLHLAGCPRTILISLYHEFEPRRVFEIDESLQVTDQSLHYLADLANWCRWIAVGRKFRFDTGWKRVHTANMSKVRAKDNTGKRGSMWDVVKPEGWEAPTMVDLV